MPQIYKYRSLASTSTIRLIKLEQQKVDDRIACTIRHAEQSADDTVYDALSYFWGNPKATREIRIRNDMEEEWSVLKLHENLWAFLDSAWQRKLFDRWFWTDRICLDQSHTGRAEVGEQIPRMAEIYHNAEQVLAWLGLTVSQGERLNLAGQPYSADVHGTFVDFLNLTHATETLTAISRVKDAEYWKRIWVVQEVLSAKKVVCLLGNLEVELSTLDEVLPDPLPKGHHARTWQALRDVELFDPQRQRTIKKLNLWGLLELVGGNDYESSKLHDRVYGVLGVAAAANGLGSPTLRIRKADYEESPAFVLIDAIFESYPDWNPMSSDNPHYTTALNLLFGERHGGMIPKDASVFRMFQDYIDCERTSARHKHFATLVLRTCNALFFVISSSTYLAELHKSLIPKLKKGFKSEDKRVGPTAQHYVVLLGVAIVLGISDRETRAQVYANWRNGPEAENKSFAKGLWRCFDHFSSELTPERFEASRGRYSHEEMLQWKYDDTAHTATNLTRNVVIPQCIELGCRTGPEANEMEVSVFEIPEGGLRIGLARRPGLFRPELGRLTGPEANEMEVSVGLTRRMGLKRPELLMRRGRPRTELHIWLLPPFTESQKDFQEYL